MNSYLFANEECSSGCESGWTLYLDHSSSISQYNQETDYLDERKNGVFTEAKRLKQESEEDEEEDEDLSMVSDASSGPPHLHEESHEGYGGLNHDNVNGGFCHYTINDEDHLSRNSFNYRKKNRENNRRRKAQDQSSLLDDTASSPFLDFSNNSLSQTRNYQPEPSVDNVLEYSQGYSTTQFEVRPPYQEQYDFFQSGNQLQQNQWFEGKTW